MWEDLRGEVEELFAPANGARLWERMAGALWELQQRIREERSHPYELERKAWRARRARRLAGGAAAITHCVMCGKYLSGKTGRQIYCDGECRAAYHNAVVSEAKAKRRAAAPVRHCGWCGKALPPPRASGGGKPQKWCNRKCQRTAQKEGKT